MWYIPRGMLVQSKVKKGQLRAIWDIQWVRVAEHGKSGRVSEWLITVHRYLAMLTFVFKDGKQTLKDFTIPLCGIPYHDTFSNFYFTSMNDSLPSLCICSTATLNACYILSGFIWVTFLSSTHIVKGEICQMAQDCELDFLLSVTYGWGSHLIFVWDLGIPRMILMK